MPPSDGAGTALVFLQWLGGPAAVALLSPGSTFSIVSLIAAGGLGCAVLALRRWRNGRRVRARSLLLALTPRRLVSGASARADIGFFLLNSFVTASLIGWGLLSAASVTGWCESQLATVFGPPGPLVLPGWCAAAVQTALLFLAYELGYWVDHYLKHRIPFLWEFHRVHHTAETLSPLTVFRMHPVDTLVFANILVIASGTTSAVSRYLLGGADNEITLFGTNVVMLCFIFTTQHLQHSHVWLAFTGVWGRILASPAHHQIHHSADPEHFGKNLGSFLSVWDWLFDTLHVPQRRREVTRFGAAAESDRPHSITGGLVTPFLRSLQRPVAPVAAAISGRDPAPVIAEVIMVRDTSEQMRPTSKEIAMRAYAFAALVGSSLLLLPAASRADGAVAHGRDGSNGLAYNYPGPRAAEDAALGYCGSRDCEIVRRFRHACAAIARSSGGGYGYAVRDHEGQAQRAAMEECEGRNNRCRIFLSGCDD